MPPIVRRIGGSEVQSLRARTTFHQSPVSVKQVVEKSA